MAAKSGRSAQNKSLGRLVLATLMIFAVGASVTNAIVKQQQQPSTSSQQQQQRSDDSSQQSGAYNNHQHQASVSSALPSGQQQAPGQSAQQQQQQQQQASSLQQSSAQSSYGASANGMSSVQPAAASGYANNQKASSGYLDSMAAAASNPEQSYQAAAQSVNMALASSGILNSNNAYNQQPGAGQGQQQQQQSGAGTGSQAASSLNPLHYFYYPAAKESIQGPSKQADAMASSANNQYPSMGSYSSYADQYQAGSYANANGPDMAASSQDASYLPQPMDGQGGQQPSQQQPLQQQHQQQQPAQNNYNNDLASYASSQIQQQQPAPSQAQGGAGSISFNGPSSGPGSQSQGGQMASSAVDYMNSHMGGHQQQQASVASGPPAASYQQNGQNMFNQLASGGDLSTSNFGNNAGGMSSIASYMAPNGLVNSAGNSQPSTHDLFGGSGMLGGQFSSAASQLSPASIPPPSSVQQQQQQQQQSQQAGGQSSLFSSSLFGSQSQQPAGQQQQAGLFGAGSSSYLNSFLTPQQYSQLTGQQIGAMASEHTPMSLASAIGAQQQQQQQQAQQAAMPAHQAASSLVSSSTSSKRFGLGSFIMPMLALAGLSLLIPTMSNLGTAVGRKKRSLVEEKASASNRQQQIAYEPLVNGPSQLLKEGSIGEYLERIERYYGIYKNAVESDECMSRLICEFGDAVKDIGGKGPVMSVIEHLVPSWMTGKMHLFKEAAMSSKESSKEKCKKYVCQNVGGAGRQH
jgi:hypothetical protein